MKKHLSAYLLLIFLYVTFFVGCQNVSEEVISQPAAPVEIMIPLVTEEPTVNVDQPPVSTPALSPEDAFSALDQEVFSFLATGDWYTLQNFLKNPSNLGIDASNIPISWGKYSILQTEEDMLTMQGFLDRLKMIDREGLAQRDQLGYDVLEAYLAGQIQQGQYPLYEEPLSPLSGLHSTIPLMLGIYPISSVSDAQEYLALLQDVPRYIAEVLEFERQKAANGLFMTKDALEMVLGQLEEVLKEEEYFFLYESFTTALENIPDLEDTEREALINQNISGVEGFMEAYHVLYQGLTELSGTCRHIGGQYTLGDGAEAYFAARMNDLGCTIEADPEEILNLLQEEVYHLSVSASLIRMNHPDAYDDLEDMEISSDISWELDYLKGIANGLLGELPVHSLNVVDIPESMQNQSSPAIFVKPAIDHWTENQILFGESFANAEGYLALAHETYPGHLYQFVSQRAIEDLPLTQRILPLTGYEEGWSTIAERMFIETQGRFPRDGLLLYHYDTTVIHQLLPAIVSIRVNAMGDGIDEVRRYLKSYAMEDNAEVYYQYAVMDPYYYLPYAIGYASLSSMMRQAENDLGEEFDAGDYLAAYLNQGPAQYPILQEQMDIWIDEKFSH